MTRSGANENPKMTSFISTRYLVIVWLALLTSIQTVAQSEPYAINTVAEGLDHPWSMVQLPGGDFLVTERTGELLLVTQDGLSQAIEGVPASYFAGQGGLLDVVLHPDFESNQLVYLSYAHGTPEANGTAIARAVLQGNRLQEAEQILLVDPLKATAQHYGGRLLFLPDNSLMVTVGEGFDYREAAQDVENEMGSVLRINDDGSIPADNPFSQAQSRRIWSYGHRNPQGLVVDPDSGIVYLHEHGPKGGDEINVILPGLNYGWPAITYGLDYNGAHVSPFTAAEGMEQPMRYWTPSIAPSSMVLYTGDAFPQWRGDLLVGTLVDNDVKRWDLEEGAVVGEASLFASLGERIREVYVGRDGQLYLLTDGENARLLRVDPQ